MRTGMKRLSLAILVPSGAISRDYQLRVSSEGDSIAFTYIWPLAMSHTQVLLRLCKNGDRIDINEDVYLRSISFDVFF